MIVAADCIRHANHSNKPPSIKLAVFSFSNRFRIRQKKAVSANLALRAQFCFGLPGDLLIRLQAQFDYQKAFHGKSPDLQMEVRSIA